jgi:hypothetical protein
MQKYLGRIYLNNSELDTAFAQVLRKVAELFGLQTIEEKRRGRGR